MNKLTSTKRASIVAALVEGNSIASTCRMTGVAKMTVLKLLADVGTACSRLQDVWLRDVDAKRVQVDEIWSFVGMKAKNVPVEKRETFGYGDVWTFTAIDADSKLLISWMLGRRNETTATEFICDLASRLRGRVQLTTDGHGMYPGAVDAAFAPDEIDYAALVKQYGEAPKEERRKYSPARYIGSEIHNWFGEPDKAHVSTSYVERSNLTWRMSNRRMTRLTNAFSKKLENHAHQLAINVMYYNFVRIHQTLRCSPAMAAGVTSELWSVADMVRVTDEWAVTREWELAQRAG